MNAVNKLPLLRNSFKLLLSTLQADDTIAIVTYAGSAGTVLEPTAVGEKSKIIAALDRLRSGGSTPVPKASVRPIN
ncbi:MAG: Ca-activated chloride channel family protein [Gammaproteobacteria bacterium]|jgi:Ca-activated chloride channel family protein